MKKLLLLSITVLTSILFSCNKNENQIGNDKISIRGTWNEDLIKWFDNKGNLTHQESLDTIRLIKLSINDFVIQEMHIDTLNSYYFLMYSTYELKNGILKQHPDSLLDIDMRSYSWNPENSTFGNFPISAHPIESTIEQPDISIFIEKRRIENIGGLDINYNRLSSECIDLKNEFEAQCNDLRNNKHVKLKYNFINQKLITNH